MEESFAMKGGVGPTSYRHNSKFQAKQIEQAKALLIDGIQQNLAPLVNRNNASHHVFHIVDLGCSVGPNTLTCIQIIIDAVVSVYKAKDLESKIPEFQVFFNDQVGNDFNSLFASLPPNRLYSAAGVPGSFYGRLFPKSSVDIFNSSYALHWLSRAPEGVKNPASPAWNKGRVSYAESGPEVVEAYEAQFERDIRSFFEARSAEMADGALMTILMPCRRKGTAAFDAAFAKMYECFGHALMDMVKEGLVGEELVDSFNLQSFVPTASDVTEVASKVEGLSLELAKETDYPAPFRTQEEIAMFNPHIRAAFEGILCQHFGPAITDVVFERLPEKLEMMSRTPSFLSSPKVENLFMVIKKIEVSV